MVAHLHCTCFDKDIIPASLSKNVINFLRKDLNYNGVLISDDMRMKGVESFGRLDSLVNGIEAGLDMFIIRDSNPDTIKMIDKLVKIVEKDGNLKNKVIESNKRIERLKTEYKITEAQIF